MKQPRMMKTTAGILMMILLMVSSVSAFIAPSIEPALKPGVEYQFKNTGLREPIGDNAQALSGRDLLGLRGGKLTTSQGETRYVQNLQFQNAAGDFQDVAVNFIENDENEAGDYLVVDSDKPFMEWSLTFPQGLKAKTNVEGTYKELENLQLNVMGEQYYISHASLAASGQMDLQLRRQGVRAYQGEGSTQTYLFEGVEYEVTPIYIANGDVKFMVNGEVTSTLQEGEFEMLSNGVIIGVEDVRSFSIQPAELKKVAIREGTAFYLTSRVIEFRSEDMAGTFGGTVKVNNEHINDADVAMNGMSSSACGGTSDGIVTCTYLVTLNSIKYRLTMDADTGSTAYVENGRSISHVMNEPEGLLSEQWNLAYRGFETQEGEEELLQLKAHGDDQYNIEYTNNLGETYSFPYISNMNGQLKWGDDDDDFHFTEAQRVPVTGTGTGFLEDDVIVIDTVAGGKDIVRYESHDPSERTVTFRHNGVQIVATYNGTPGVNAEGELVVNGISYPMEVLDEDEIKLQNAELFGVITNDDYFLLSKEPYSSVWRYDDVDVSTRTLEFKNMATGQTTTTTYNGEPGLGAYTDLVVGGNTFRVWVLEDLSLVIDLDGQYGPNTVQGNLYTSNGAILYLAAGNWKPASANYMSLHKDVTGNFDWEQYGWRVVVRPGNEVGIVADNNFQGPFAGWDVWNRFFITEVVDGSDYYEGLTDYGTRIQYYNGVDDAEELTVVIPASREKVGVFVEMQPLASILTVSEPELVKSESVSEPVKVESKTLTLH